MFDFSWTGRAAAFVGLWALFGLVAGSLIGQAPPTISAFPYQPDETQQVADFKVNYGTGPAPAGSAWLNGVINGNRRGQGGAGVQAWANRPTASYLNSTTTWLHSPIFNFTGQSGLSLDYYLWVRAQSGQDGMKLQVSTNGGTVWADVTTSSVAYNGNTNTSGLLATKFGGGNTAWTATSLGGASANLCTLNLNTWAGMADVRFRWCFVSNASTVNDGPVVDNFKVIYVTATTAYASGFASVPQGQTVNATVTKTEGQAFTAGMTVSVQGSGVTGSVVSVTNANVCTVAFTATKMADIGLHNYSILLGGNTLCQSTMEVFSPQRLISNREAGSTQEPPQNASMGGTSVYLHNGEFRHDLPMVSIPGRMLPLAIGITYRSGLDCMGTLGRGWSTSFDVRLSYVSNVITLYGGDGRIDNFTLQAGGTSGVGPYIKTGFFVEFTRSDNGTPANDADDLFTLTGPHGSTVTFTSPVDSDKNTANVRIYRQSVIKDRFNNAVSFVYNKFGQVDEILGDMWDALSPTRYKLDLEYGPHGRLTFIRDYADYTAQAGVIGGTYASQREWEFVYNSTTAELTEIKLPKTERYYSDTQGANYRSCVKFGYDGTSNMTEVIDARQANEAAPIGWLLNHYNGSGKVDYQDVGRSSGADTTHRNHIVYTSATDVSTVDAESHRSQFLLNANGTCTTIKHFTGTWNSVLTQTGAKLRASDPNSYDSTFTYDSEFNTISVTYPSGRVTRFRYDLTNSSQRSRGNLLRVLVFKGSVSPDLLPADQINGLLATFTYTNSAAFNLLATSVSPRAYVLGASYDIVTNSPITTNQSAEFTTTNTYNADGTLANVKSPTVSTAISPDTLNNGQFLQTLYTYNSFKQLETVTDQAGVVTRYEYGSSGFEKGYLAKMKAGFQTGLPLETGFDYNSVGRVTSVGDPRGYTYTSFINQLDQSVRSETPTISAASNVNYFTQAEFDLNGNIETFKVANIDENGVTQMPSTINTTYAYNLLDLVTSVTEPIDLSTSRSSSFSYDKIFRQVESTLPEGNKAATDFDEINRAIKSYFGFDSTNIAKASALIQSEVFYDLNSNVTRSVDGRGNDSQYIFDAFDRCTKAEDRLVAPNFTELTYDRASNVTLSVRKGKLRTYNSGSDSYAFVAGTELGRAETRFDNIGRAYFARGKAHNHDLTANLGYSNYETPPVGTSDGWSASVVKFRSNGQVEETRDDLLYPTKYSYDAYNRLSRVTDDRDGIGASDNFDEYGYDANGNATSVRAVLYDDRNPGSPAKDVTTLFSFDEINRMIQDQAPPINGVSMLRSFKYDSRSQLIDSTDRKGQVRHSEYDLLGRLTRQRAYVIMREIDPSTGYVTASTKTVASRAVYDKNSNVLESIDATGNRTYSRHDMAGRWVQTQHADGGAGSALKSSAGTTHSVSQFPGTNFWSASSAYDGNSNLLNLKDENDTLRSWSFDENDQLLSETGAPAAGNPFGIEGETGLSYLYDGLYRAAFGETHDGTGTLTDTESVFNTLGGLERQRQRVMRAHPSLPGLTESGSVVSEFDESGRRFARRNPGDISRTAWAFDRKHRPTSSYLEYGTGGGWTPPVLLSEYKYLGGGFLHSKHVKYMNQPTAGGTVNVPIVSEFERDNLLRLTSVRHIRDDAGIGSSMRLLGRYDYAYDENSMMKYEARWHEQDFAGGVPKASTTPDEVDFYSYSSDNQLEKALYNVTQDDVGGSAAVDLSSLNWANIDSNNVTCTDRVIYSRRVSGTRQRVNWYRGSPTRTSAIPGSFDESANAPAQKTHYDTSDDPTATPDLPASDGQGSRHNYIVIGNIGHGYDKNRNLTSDATREFRYSYNNQLRRVWRKSDGSAAGDGLLAKYREDAFGRRVHAESYWELSRHDTLDTRFSVDINVDEDADSAAIQYVNGGITSLLIPPPGQLDQKAAWDSRIKRSITNTNESHYFDFLLEVPSAGNNEYLGFVAYDRFELRVYGGRYEMWDTAGPALLGTHNTTTQGRHNIGIRAGTGYGVFIDGAAIANLTSLGSIGLVPDPKARFGTHVNASGSALTLWENLCYLKSYNRGVVEEDSIPGGPTPRATVTFFDGPKPVTVREPINTDPALQVVNYTEDQRSEHRDGLATKEQIAEPNGRMHTGQVVTQSSDGATYDGTGNRSELEEPMPGVGIYLHEAADGSQTAERRTSAAAPVEPCWTGGTLTFEFTGIYEYNSVTLQPGKPGDGTTTDTDTPHASSVPGGATNVEMATSFTSGVGPCACQGSKPHEPGTSHGYVNPCTGMHEDLIGGNANDRVTGVMIFGGSITGPGGSGIQVFGESYDEAVKRFYEAAKRGNSAPKPTSTGIKCETGHHQSQAEDPTLSSGRAPQDPMKWLQWVLLDSFALVGSIAASATPFGWVGVIASSVALLAHATLWLDAMLNASGVDLLGDNARAIVEGLGAIASFVSAISGIAGMAGLATKLGGVAGTMKGALAGGGETVVAGTGGLSAVAARDLDAALGNIIKVAAGVAGVKESVFLSKRAAAAAGAPVPDWRKMLKTAKTPVHHIAPKGDDRLRKIFEEVGADIDYDDANLMELPGHCGGHTNAYRDYVLEKLRHAVDGETRVMLKKQALNDALAKLREELTKNPRLPYKDGGLK